MKLELNIFAKQRKKTKTIKYKYDWSKIGIIDHLIDVETQLKKQ